MSVIWMYPMFAIPETNSFNVRKQVDEGNQQDTISIDGLPIINSRV